MNNNKGLSGEDVAKIISAIAGGIVSIIYAYKSLIFWCGEDVFPWLKRK